jgi:hypothetical protein
MDPILAALRQLDPLNDEHWTDNGDPRIDAVQALVGTDTKVTRQLIVAAAPDLNRKKAEQPESLLMNTTEAVASEVPTGPVLVDGGPEAMNVMPNTGDRYIDLTTGLLQGTEGVAQGLISKVFHEWQVLREQELHVLLGYLDPTQLWAFAEASEILQTQMLERIKQEQAIAASVKIMVATAKNRAQVVAPDKSNQEAIGDYIANQNAARASAHANRVTILKGINLADINPIAPIDAAMARKTARGMERPKF